MNTTTLMGWAMARQGTRCVTSPIRSSRRVRASAALLAWIRGESAGMAGAPGLEQVQGRAIPHLANDDPVGPQPKGVADQSYFLARGTTHVEETPAGQPTRHAVIVDLKDGAPAAPSPAAFAGGQAARKVTENARVILWDYAWPAKPAQP
jgi:hypothetical protein